MILLAAILSTLLCAIPAVGGGVESPDHPFENLEARLRAPLDSLAAASGLDRDDLRINPAGYRLAGSGRQLMPLVEYLVSEPWRGPEAVSHLSGYLRDHPPAEITGTAWAIHNLSLAQSGAVFFAGSRPGPWVEWEGDEGTPDLEAAVVRLFEGSGKRFRGRDREVFVNEAATLDPSVAVFLAGLLITLGEAADRRDSLIALSGFEQGGIFNSKSRRTRDLLSLFLSQSSAGDLDGSVAMEIARGARGFPYADVYRTSVYLTFAVEQLLGSLTERAHGESPEREFQFSWWTPRGEIRVGGAGPNHYRGHALAVLDLGGDDVYEGTGAVEGTELGVSIVIDLGGNDLYAPADSGRAAPGTGILGLGGVWDLGSGEDRYEGEALGAGFGCFGVGWVVDQAGDDTYSFSALAEGAGVHGLGLLRDLAGNDTYVLGQGLTGGGGGLGQGFGGTGGIGALADMDGQDSYRAVGRGGIGIDSALEQQQGEPPRFVQGSGAADIPGWNPAFPLDPSYLGGLGILVDRSGNDRYECAGPGQGYGQSFGCGVLFDGAGDDVNLLGGMGLGCGVRGGYGAALDAAGDDRRAAGGGGVYGFGSEWGQGVLVDGGGDDEYLGGWDGVGLDGSGAGFLIDLGGKDRYPDTDVPGHLTLRDVPGHFLGPGIAVWIDLQGPDAWTGSPIDAEPGTLSIIPLPRKSLIGGAVFMGPVDSLATPPPNR